VSASRGFDRLARWYRLLEFAAFGRDLERARFAFLGELAGRGDILLLGEGDVSCAERVAAVAPGARIRCVDSSAGMIERASLRLSAAGALGRVSFERADLRSYAPRAGEYDAVATLFVLDCFDAADVAAIVRRVGAALRPGAPWLFADFVLPPRGLARARARVWLWVLYGFFRLETGLRVAALPPSEAILGEAGWLPHRSLELQRGLVRSAVYARAPATAARSASAAPGPKAR
jgi:ubiquinone/menaquinone biosynthesis C-methylase UbiE